MPEDTNNPSTYDPNYDPILEKRKADARRQAMLNPGGNGEIEQLYSRVMGSAPGLAVGAVEQAPGVVMDAIGSAMKPLGRFLRDPFGDSPQQPPAATQAAKAAVTPEDHQAVEQREDYVTGQNYGPSRDEGLGRVNLNVGKKTYQYGGATTGTTGGHLVDDSKSTFSQIGLSPDSPGGQELAKAERQRKLDELGQMTGIATQQEKLRQAGLTPQQAAREKAYGTSADIEAIMGETRDSFVSRAATAATQRLQANPEFAKLPPQQQQAFLNNTRMQATQDAIDRYNSSAKEIYTKKYPTGLVQ